MSAIKVQVAVQGGGAKLVALLAALEKVQELEHEGLIKVTRIAGTSAGAVVGCLFAAGIPMGEVKESLRGIPKKALSRAFQRPKGPFSYVSVLRKLWVGDPIWSADPVRQRLRGFFEPRKIYTFADLRKERGIEVRVLSADIVEFRKKVYSDDDSVVQALLDSSAIPLAFRNFKSVNGVIVDGGICENLPSDLLEDKPEYGPVVAISFQPRAEPEPKDLKQYLMALLSTAITNSMSRAKSRLPEGYVHHIVTSIDTFDFVKALEHGLADEPYADAKTQTERFFQSFVARRKALLVEPDPWLTTDPELRETMAKLGDVYRCQHAPLKFLYEGCSMEVTANCLVEEGQPFFGLPDITRFSLQFRTLDQPIHCHRVRLGAPGNPVFHNKSEIEVSGPNGDAIETIRLPSIDRTQQSPHPHRDVLIFFHDPLPPHTGPYGLRYLNLVTDFTRPLRDTNEDEFWITFVRAAGRVASATIVLHLPLRFKYSNVAAMENSAPGESMPPQQRDQLSAPPGFHTFGWCGKDLDASIGRFGFRVKLLQ